MPFGLGILEASAAVAGVVALVGLFSGSDSFVSRPCGEFETLLTSQLVGQDLALQQFSDAVCDHLAKEGQFRPLVVSFHGPPGVGKSLLHLLAARALYNDKVTAALQCPGRDCSGYKVMYGMDYMASERELQHRLLREALITHLRQHPQSLLVIEEYDKIDCPTRGMLRQLLENPQSANVTIGQSIVLLESNMGYDQLYKLMRDAKAQGKPVSAEAAGQTLKNLVFDTWRDGGCEGFADTAKSVGLVDFYLPFFPLERQHIQQLFDLKLGERVAAAHAEGLPEVSWHPSVVDFLTDKVDFDGDHPVEGAKEVATLMTRYVARALRVWEQGIREHAPQQAVAKHSWLIKRPTLKLVCPECPRGHLQIARQGIGIEVVSL